MSKPTDKAHRSTCEHIWNYVHVVYSSGDQDTVVRRWCPACGKCQVGVVTLWRAEHKKEFDHTPSQAERGEVS